MDGKMLEPSSVSEVLQRVPTTQLVLIQPSAGFLGFLCPVPHPVSLWNEPCHTLLWVEPRHTWLWARTPSYRLWVEPCHTWLWG